MVGQRLFQADPKACQIADGYFQARLKMLRIGEQ